MSTLIEKVEEILSATEEGNVTAMSAAFKDAMGHKLTEKINAKKQELVKSLFSENYEGKNFIDGLKRVVDVGRDQTITLDNGEELILAPEDAKAMVDLFNLYDEREQFDLQRKMRKSKMDFLDVMAAAGAPGALAHTAEE